MDGQSLEQSSFGLPIPPATLRRRATTYLIQLLGPLLGLYACSGAAQAPTETSPAIASTVAPTDDALSPVSTDTSVGLLDLGVDIPDAIPSGDDIGAAPADTGRGDARGIPEAGCRPTDCKTGVCGPEGVCVDCVKDTDCSGVKSTCCKSTCVNVKKDPVNCGACGVMCTSKEFCTGTSCKALTFGNLCENPSMAVIQDGLATDDAASSLLVSALKTCVPTVAVRTVKQDAAVAAGVLELATGRPIAGPGDTCVAAGGPFGQQAVAFVEKGTSPVLFVGDATTAAFIERSTGKTIAKGEMSTLNSHHDFFVVELALEGTTGTVLMAVYGITGEGTLAAVWYFNNRILPAKGTLTDSWYVVEWTDKNGNSLADSGDTFTTVGSAK